jgi:dTDP-4-dehydrorhamnose reductase
MEIWGGIECTIQRIGDSFGNQLERSGHLHRISDLDAIAELGIKTLRYPVMWEMIAPDGLKYADWSWTDERLQKLRQLEIRPVVTLLHHGSGPLHTSLIDPSFPEKFTEYAVAVAERYPWLEYFTPINEPLTTARFSCLYGHWYPHKKNLKSFGIALTNECRATIMAMKEIRKRIPQAKLVQTEDMGYCHGVEMLRYQCDMENQRRWSSFDLLTGRVDENEFITKILRKVPGLKLKLDYFRKEICKPDIMGINYYITSERYLDDQYWKHPEWSHGTNGKHKYADIDIVRADIYQRKGHYEILKQVWNRYKLPLALTEVHMGATRDEQMRWLMEAWKAATKLKNEGVDMRAITAWSLFGAFDWNSLLTRKNNFYETGAFDVSSGKVRPTAVAKILKTLCSGEKPQHHALQSEGWWKNPGTVNFLFGCNQEERQLTTVDDSTAQLPFPAPKPILITGATGVLGTAFARICRIRNLSCVILSRKDMDIANREVVSKVIAHYQPWAVVNAAGYVRVDEAEDNPTLCLRENTEGPATLAYACRKFDCLYLTFSSDFVFNGDTRSPYRESDQARPINVYGVSKYLAESRVLNANPQAIVVRTSSFFGPWDRYNFLSEMMTSIENERTFKTSSAYVMSPTYVPDLVHACLDLLMDEEKGVWHIAHPSAVTWFDFARMTAEMAGLKTNLIRTVNPTSLGHRAPRPAYSALHSERGLLMPTLESAIERFLIDRRKQLQL